MPRRSVADPLAKAVGRRIRQLRREAGLTLEKLAYEIELGSKGYLSDIEHGLAMPSLATLKVVADRLEIDLLDLLTFPRRNARHRLVDCTRRASKEEILRVAEDLSRTAYGAKPPKAEPTTRPPRPRAS
jgi:transcriptional regulator with XRE-family HTH domain